MAGIDEALKEAAETHIISPEKATSILLGHRPKSEALIRAIICDIDGTLASHEGIRGHYDWSDVGKDKIVEHVHRMIRVYHDHLHFQIIYLTGRPEDCRKETEEWLTLHKCPPGPVLMGPKGHRLPTNKVKTDLYNDRVKGKYQVEFCLDDRDQNVKMWRDLGIPCLQVAEGDF